MAKAKKVTLAALVPENALGTKFVSTGYLAEVFKTVDNGNGKMVETDEIIGHYIGIQLIDPINKDLTRLSINVKVNNLIEIDEKLQQALLSYSIINFTDLRIGEFNGNFWANASGLTIIQNRSSNK